jgi:hypothetical protein
MIRTVRSKIDRHMIALVYIAVIVTVILWRISCQ